MPRQASTATASSRARWWQIAPAKPGWQTNWQGEASCQHHNIACHGKPRQLDCHQGMATASLARYPCIHTQILGQPGSDSTQCSKLR